MTKDEWGPWIEHDGRDCPVPTGTFVNVIEVLVNGSQRELVGISRAKGIENHGSWNWANWPIYTRILRYRVRKPKGMTVLEELMEEIKPKVDASTPHGGRIR